MKLSHHFIISHFKVENPYGEIESELIRFSANCSSILMLGDFNSRTKNILDYVIPDNDIFENTNQSEILEELQSDLRHFEDSVTFSLHRRNSDTGVNNYGYKMVEFCIDNNMYILNGRGNIDSCRTTCKNVSTIDYFLSSPNIIPLLQTLYVHEFCHLLSDLHNAVSLDISIQYMEERSTFNSERNENIRLWNSDETATFVNSFDPQNTKELLNMLSELKSKDNVSQHDIDNFVNYFNDFHMEKCRASFGIVVQQTPSKQSNKNKTPRWYGKKCKTARIKFHKSKYRYKLRKTEENKHSLNISSKAYKKTLTEAQSAYKNSKIKELRNIKTSNPRKYWKFLNENKKPKTNLSVDMAYEYFSNINLSADINDTDTNFNYTEIPSRPENAEINSPISLEEIRQAVRCLKNNKSNGIDMILNEHIQYSFELPYMPEIYLHLFNLVFDTGLLPEPWSIGKIIPIYKQKGQTTDPSNYRPITLLSCMGKLFTAVINNRLQSYAEKYDKIRECQAGFRKNFSTVDHIFALHTIINLLHRCKKKLFCVSLI